MRKEGEFCWSIWKCGVTNIVIKLWPPYVIGDIGGC